MYIKIKTHVNVAIIIQNYFQNSLLNVNGRNILQCSLNYSFFLCNYLVFSCTCFVLFLYQYYSFLVRASLFSCTSLDLSLFLPSSVHVLCSFLRYTCLVLSLFNIINVFYLLYSFPKSSVCSNRILIFIPSLPCFLSQLFFDTIWVNMV